LIIPAAGLALLVLDAPRVAATACTPSSCLTNSAVVQRIIPDTALTDNAGDAKFFSASNNALPNVVIVLDNSTSMYELPYDANAFPNSAWVSKGTTPNMGTGAGAGKNLDDPANLATCHSNKFFEGDPTTINAQGNPCTPAVAPPAIDPLCQPTPRFCTDPFSVSCDKTKPVYNKDRTNPYPVTDPSFSAYFDPNKNYKFFEWAASTITPGGAANSTSPVQPSSSPGNATIDVAAATNGYGACSTLSTVKGSGGSTTINSTTYRITQQQRCQQCVDEAGYYIASNATSTDSNSGRIVFSGNWLNYYPPKFLIARKTVTDFITSQPSKPPNEQVRVGIVTYDPNNLNSTNVPAVSTGMAATNDGGKFVSSGMTPSCGNTTWDPVSGGNTPTNLSSQVGTLVSRVNAINWGTSGSPIGTPLAETLFNVGQFYGGDNTFYTSKFGVQWLKPGFTAPTDGSKPICAACQVNAIVLITDGQPEGDNNLPAQFRTNSIDCSPAGTAANPTCGKDLFNNTVNLLDDVTNFLATNDLATGSDANFVGTQSVLTYIIGLGLKVPLLDNAARFGKTSSAIRADNSNQILSALQISVQSVISRATAFSSTAIQTLEVGTGSTALVPRFIPGNNTDANWEGHLFRFNLFNEFVAGVDKNGDGNLNGVFLVDADGDIVTEDDQGAFHKETCSGGSCTVVGVANPIWDAGGCSASGGTCNTLASTPAANRNLYTAIWNGSAWQTIPWPTQISDPNFAAVENALNIDGNTVCSIIQQRLQTPAAGSKYFTSTGGFDRDHCALAIMDYVRGFNVLNEVAIPTGSTVTDATTLNRTHMLGDIFHSSPVVVGPPVDQFLCSLGLDAQCLSTLYQDALPSNGAIAPTPSESTTVSFAGEPTDAYEKYWEDHETRKRVVVVGANDGMLHAFNAGDATTNPPTITEPLHGLRTVTYSDGDGSEVWGFITPDQIPRLWLAMRDGHQTYMDGDIMVRDVWVDGQGNDKTAHYNNTPGVKEAAEYHTIAIASERQGGTHYVALDVTDTTTPKMLWMYPPPCSPEEELWGETWGQFSPRPPPIGPVLLQNASTGPSNYGYPHTEERWVAFLNGGHDAYDTRGRAAAIVDAYTGSPLFVAKYNPTSGDASDPAKAMRFGFPATASMADWGRTNTFQQDGFFDTAVLGDEGGQIWTFRFGEPGHINTSTGLVDNWTFGRAFEPNTSSPNNANVHNPIYTATSLTVDTNNWLRAYVGTGDRAHVRSLKGGDCRPDDPMTCIQAGCTVNSSLTMDNGPNHLASTFVSGATAATVGTSGQTQTTTAASCTLGSVNYNFTTSACPSPMAAISESLTFAEDGGTGFTQADGGIDGGNIETAMAAPSDQIRDAGVPATLSTYTGANSFVSVVVEGSGVVPASAPTTTVSRLMSLPSEADAYDNARFDAYGTPDLVDVTGASATSTAVAGNKAPVNGAGWILKYVINNTVPVVNADGTTTTVPASIDEKTVTSASIQGGCVLWSTLIPFANGGGTLGCASAGSSVAPFYQADAFTGAPNCASSFLGYNGAANNYVRFIPRNVISPPPEPSPAVAVGSGGSGVRFSTLEIQPGASEVTQMTVGTSNDILQMVYSLPLTSDQHTCRHVDATKCE
jgi:type IV pilus assembly protein PilY1